MKKSKLYVDQLLARLAKQAKAKKPKQPLTYHICEEIHAFKAKPVSETGMRESELYDKLRLHFPSEMDMIVPKPHKPAVAKSAIVKDDVPELPDNVRIKTGEEHD